MNCQTVRNRILALERPSTPPYDVAEHLERCPACRSWRAKLLRLDEALPQLPTYGSDGLAKVAVLERIKAGKPSKPHDEPKPSRKAGSSVGPRPRPEPIELSPEPEPVKPRPLDLEAELPKPRFAFGKFAAKFWPAGVVAATILVGAIAWFSVSGDKPSPPAAAPSDPLLNSVVKLNVELANTRTAAERLDILARLAEELNQQMRDIARADATGESMESLEVMYRRVVANGLIAQARLVERRERETVLVPVVNNLLRAGERAEQTAFEAPAHSARRLRDAAETARATAANIRKLIQEEA